MTFSQDCKADHALRVAIIWSKLFVLREQTIGEITILSRHLLAMQSKEERRKGTKQGQSVIPTAPRSVLSILFYAFGICILSRRFVQDFDRHVVRGDEARVCGVPNASASWGLDLDVPDAEGHLLSYHLTSHSPAWPLGKASHFPVSWERVTCPSSVREKVSHFASVPGGYVFSWGSVMTTKSSRPPSASPTRPNAWSAVPTGYVCSEQGSDSSVGYTMTDPGGRASFRKSVVLAWFIYVPSRALYVGLQGSVRRRHGLESCDWGFT